MSSACLVRLSGSHRLVLALFFLVMVLGSSPLAAQNRVERVSVASEGRDHVVFDIDYSYGGDHGEPVFISVVMAHDGEVSQHYAYRPARLQRGRQRAQVWLGVAEGAPAAFSTNQIRVRMYDTAGEYFLNNDFSFFKTWSRAGAALPPVLRIIGRPPSTAGTLLLEPPQQLVPDTGPATEGVSGEPVRRVLPNGHVELRYPDGRIVERYRGGFAETLPDGTRQRYAFASAQPPTPPSAPPDATHAIWLERENERLLGIIRTLVGGHQPSIDHYLAHEGPAMSLYERIGSRTEAIEWLVSP